LEKEIKSFYFQKHDEGEKLFSCYFFKQLNTNSYALEFQQTKTFLNTTCSGFFVNFFRLILGLLFIIWLRIMNNFYVFI